MFMESDLDDGASYRVALQRLDVASGACKEDCKLQNTMVTDASVLSAKAYIRAERVNRVHHGEFSV